MRMNEPAVDTRERWNAVRTVLAGQKVNPAAVPIRPGHDGTPLFFVPGGKAGLAELTLYTRFLDGMAGAHPVYGLPAPVPNGPGVPHVSVADIARRHVEAIQEMQPAGPYALAGECVGGIVAWEIARLLQCQGERVAVLVLMDTWFPSARAERRHRFYERYVDLAQARLLSVRAAVADLRAVAAGHWQALRRLRGRDRLVQAQDAVAHLVRVAGRWCLALARVGRVAPDGVAGASYVPVLLRYRPAPASTRVSLIVTAPYAARGLQTPWTTVAPAGLDVHVVPGTHTSYVREHRGVTCDALRRILEGALPPTVQGDRPAGPSEAPA